MALDDFPGFFARQFPHRLGQRVLVALSGGADSVALLQLLGDPELRLHLEAAHVHHRARGQEADEDAEFCRSLCERLSVPFHLAWVEPAGGAPEGREAAWRRQRYRLLLDLRDRHGLDAVATAHHRDDVAEGVLLQLLRGAGPRAMAGIAPETASGVIRPLLAYGRDEILDWLARRGESWREDSSNRDLAHLRNRVRHRLLPQLRAFAPRIDAHLVALAGRLADQEAYLEGELARLAQWIDPWRPDGGVPVARVRALPRALRARWLHAQAARAGIGRVSGRQLELFDALLGRGVPRAISLAGRWRLRCARSTLWLEPPRPPAPYCIRLEPGAGVALPLPGWRIVAREGTTPRPHSDWWWAAPADGELTVRSPRPGDTVASSSGPARVTTLIAKRAPRHLRPVWPVVCQNDTITWVPGVWRDADGGTLILEVRADGRAAGGVQR